MSKLNTTEDKTSKIIVNKGTGAGGTNNKLLWEKV